MDEGKSLVEEFDGDTVLNGLAPAAHFVIEFRTFYQVIDTQWPSVNSMAACSTTIHLQYNAASLKVPT